MLPRYSHPPIAQLWTDQYQIDQWVRIEDAVLTAITGLTPINLTGGMSATSVRTLEHQTGHEVGAFLELYEKLLEEPEHRRWLHYGLTSSDLVDTARQISLWNSARIVDELAGRIYATVWGLAEVPVLGRTHGQIASPTSYRARWLAALAYLSDGEAIVATNTPPKPWGMLSGATGQHRVLDRGKAADAAYLLGVTLVAHSTQVVPAGYTLNYLEDWLRVVMLCEQIALDMRLGAMLGEVAFPANPVGSTAMPGKVNPLAAEQVCGLAKLWRGMYHAWLESRALWLDRDLHHSSLDRVALGDLAELAGYIANATHTALNCVELKPTPLNHAGSARDLMHADADQLLALATQRHDAPRSQVYQAVTEAIRNNPNGGRAMRQIQRTLTPRQAPGTVEA